MGEENGEGERGEEGEEIRFENLPLLLLSAYDAGGRAAARA